MGRSRTTQTQTQTTTPTASSDIRAGLGANQALFDTLRRREFAPFSTVAGFSGETEAALQGINNLATTPSGLDQTAENVFQGVAETGGLGAGGDFIANLAAGGNVNPARAFLEPTARGDFLDPASNPLFGRGVEAINDSVSSIFERSGRTGSGAHQDATARGIADLFANLSNQERNRQLQAASSLGGFAADDRGAAIGASQVLGADTDRRLGAAGFLPGLADNRFDNFERLGRVGEVRDAQEQALINERLDRFNFQFDNQADATARFLAGIGGLAPLAGQTTNSRSETVQNPGIANTILGGLLTGASLFAGGGNPLAGLAGLGGASRTPPVSRLNPARNFPPI